MPAPKRVMVIDDDPDFVRYVSIVLEAGGYAVDSALNLADGLATMRQTPPDLAIVDVMLSRALGGLDIGHELKCDPRLCSIPIVMVSAIVSMQDDDLFSAEQRELARDFMSKPIVPADLLQCVGALL